MEFVDEMEFDRLGVFPYSPEENTPAEGMPDQVPEEIKQERQDDLMSLQPVSYTHLGILYHRPVCGAGTVYPALRGDSESTL